MGPRVNPAGLLTAGRALLPAFYFLRGQECPRHGKRGSRPRATSLPFFLRVLRALRGEFLLPVSSASFGFSAVKFLFASGLA